MRSSAEPQINGSIPDVLGLSWSELMTEGSDALSHAVRLRREAGSAAERPDASRAGEQISIFNNYM